VSKPRYEIVAACIVRDHQVLAVQRGYGGYRGWWEFPGGKIEPGETHEEALARELFEELDATISVQEYLMTVDYEYPEFFLRMNCYLCSLDSSFTLNEHQDARWLGLDNLYSVKWLGADADVLKALEPKLTNPC
jgi:8-oxo-dGTP diphosphatase